MYLPLYSSALNPIGKSLSTDIVILEHLWSIFKFQWSKQLSKVKVDYQMDSLESDVRLILKSLNITDNLVKSVEKVH